MAKKANPSFMLDLDGIRILVTRKRVKNVNFRIGSNGEALMSVPWNTSRQRAEQYALGHLDWFKRTLARKEATKPAMPSQWESGEKVRLWGEEVELCVRETKDHSYCSLEGSLLVLSVPAGSSSEYREALVESWKRDELRLRLEDLLPECEERVGAHATSVTLRRMKTRWGSCTTSTGRIRLNTALVEAPPQCMEMVLVHELCHLHVPNHGPKFHALMDLHYPSWRVYRRYLNKSGIL